MSTAKPVQSDLSSKSNMVDIVEAACSSDFQFIFDAYLRSVAAITDSLSTPEIAATTKQLFSEFKLQQDSLVANISETLSLIDEMWLLWQSHFEQELTAGGHAVDQGGRPTTGSATAVDR